jgi:hypothetical protein
MTNGEWKSDPSSLHNVGDVQRWLDPIPVGSSGARGSCPTPAPSPVRSFHFHTSFAHITRGRCDSLRVSDPAFRGAPLKAKILRVLRLLRWRSPVRVGSWGVENAGLRHACRDEIDYGARTLWRLMRQKRLAATTPTPAADS